MLLIILIFIAPCNCLDESQDIVNFLLNGNFAFHDLSFPYDNDTIFWPGVQRFEFTEIYEVVKEDGSWYAANEFCVGEHGGTHLDAPFHFALDGKFVGDIPVRNLITPLIIVDLESQVRGNPDFVLYKHHLDYMLNNYFGNVDQNCTVIFRFGWSKFYGDYQKYLGGDGTKGSSMKFPGLSKEVAEWIVASYKNIVGVGVDTPSVDPGSSTNFSAHKTLHGAGLYHMENVKLVEHIPESSCLAVALPMKIARGTGAPLRLVAICPKQSVSDIF